MFYGVVTHRAFYFDSTRGAVTVVLEESMTDEQTSIVYAVIQQ